LDVHTVRNLSIFISSPLHAELGSREEVEQEGNGMGRKGEARVAAE
jgi:hypothetical protein